MASIILLAIAAMLLLEKFGPSSDAAGLMFWMLIFALIVLAVVMREPRSSERGPIGWIVRIFASAIGGWVGLTLISFAIDPLLAYVHFEGSIDQSEGPLKYSLVAATAVVVVLGSWLPVRIIDWLRSVPRSGPTHDRCCPH